MTDKQDNATPDNATPDNATPDNATPDNATPDNATPDNATPDNATPDNATPDVATPEESMGIVRQLSQRLQAMPNPFVVGLCHAQVLLPDDLDRLHAELPNLENATIQEIERRLVGAVEQANSTYLRLDLTMIDSFDEWALVDLSHDDVLPGLDGEHSTRKVVIFVPIEVSAPDANLEIRFEAVRKSRKIEVGEALMFPAFLSGQIWAEDSATTRGLLLYSHGPAFR